MIRYAYAYICVLMTPIKRIREGWQLTQEEFAELAGVSQANVSRWEAGGQLSLESLRRLRRNALDRGLEWDDAWFLEPEAALGNQDNATS